MNTPALLGEFYPNEQEYFCIKSKDFAWLTDEFMLYCRSTQLRDPDLRETEEYTIYDYYIQYNADNGQKGHFVRIICCPAGGMQCSINFDNEFELYFQKQ